MKDQISTSRRKFLQSSAVVASMAATASFGAETKPAKSVAHASGYGAFYADLDESGKVVSIRPQESNKDPKFPGIEGLIDRNMKNRVKYPCVRKSFLEGKNTPELRGKEEFVRVSWDKAYELVLEKLKAVKPEEIFNASYDGWSHPGILHNTVPLPGRFFNIAFGGAAITSGDYSVGAASRVNGSITGDLEVFALQTTHEVILENTKTYVLWGADILKCNQIDYRIANHANVQWYEKYAKSGIKFIAIDPQYTQIAQKFGAQWIKIRPNTDVALMLGMMNYLYTSGKYDKEFIEKYTYGFDKFLPYLLGQSEDKIEKTPTWAAGITGVSEEDIKNLADLFVSDRTLLAGSWSLQRAQHGEQMQWAMIVLACMIGQVGLPGGGFGFALHYNGNSQARSGVKMPGGISQGKNKVDLIIPASRVNEALLNPGKEINFRGEKIKLPHVKVLYAVGTNILGHHPDTNEVLKALAKVETIISQEPFWTPMSKWADIVLPTTTQLERDDIAYGGSYSQDYVYALKKVFEPPFEARNDYDIFADMAKLVSEKAWRQFTGGKDKMEQIRGLYERSDCPNYMSFDEFWEKGFVHFEPGEEARKFVRLGAFRADPVKNKLSTETGQIQIYSDKFASYNLPDFKAHPMWFEPSEWLGNKELVAKFPFHILSPHPAYRIHSNLDNSDFIRKICKVGNREPVTINDEDATALGVKDGDTVEIYNDRGRVLAGVIVSKSIMKGVVALCEGAWYDPDEEGRDQAGHINVLTTSIPTSQMAQATSANTCLVAIKKVDVAPYKGISEPKVIEG